MERLDNILETEQDEQGRTIIRVPVREIILLPKETKKENVVLYQGNKIIYQGENVK